MAQKKTIITISGSIGSGKSSTANRIAELLNYQRFSAGNVMRAMATEKNISLGELTKQALTDPSIDAAIDDALRAAGAKEKLVIDSRLGFHFIPDSFKVYIALPRAIAVDRIWDDMQHNPHRAVEQVASKDVLDHMVALRADSERIRYQQLYGVTVDDPTHFDLWVSSQTDSIEDIAQSIINAYMVWRETI